MYLGIDLGTSNSAIAGNTGSELKLFKTAEGTDVLPSVIYIDKRGHKFIGVRAYDKAILSPDNVADGFKRLMGTSSPTALTAAGVSMSPEECSAEIIRTLLAQARTEAGALTIDGTVVTVPAAFNQMQSEATIRAAAMAGLDRVGLLQEPIAAAMASMAEARTRNGQFLVYDLGGGTFDVALVQSIGGSVNVVAHEGINMYGGRDHDRKLVDEFVVPWLMETFSLPQGFQRDARYRRLVRIARYAAETAKITLSSAETAVIFAGDEEVRVTDEDGSDIYISIDICRRDIDELIGAGIAETTELCRKLLKANGYRSDDIERLVLIGGPSKIPYVRTRVPQELGIPADLKTDPMTAVALGAAVFAESREWSSEGTRRKLSRASAAVTGPIDIRYDFPGRTSADRAKIRVKPAPETDTTGHRLQIDTPEGWTSGQVDIRGDISVEVPVANIGENRFRMTVYDPAGQPVAAACSEITIARTYASAAGIPATHTIAVKVIETASGRERNELAPLVTKGTLLPASGTQAFRAAKDLRGGHAGQIDVEFYQQAEGVPEPELALFIGSIQLNGESDLEDGDLLRRGEPINILWEIDDNGILKCNLEVPTLSRTFDRRNFYAPSIGHQNFEGDDGDSLAKAYLDEADHDVDTLRRTLGGKAGPDVGRLMQRVERQRQALMQAADADARRSVTEEARAIRQEISRLRHIPENRKHVLMQELAERQEAFDNLVREHADGTSTDLFERSAETCRRAIENGDEKEAERALHEMASIYFREFWRSPGCVLYLFKLVSTERHLAVDKGRHEALVAEGQRAAAANEIDALRQVLAEMLNNRLPFSSGETAIAGMAGLMRG